jgi:hypothetical protein
VVQSFARAENPSLHRYERRFAGLTVGTNHVAKV